MRVRGGSVVGFVSSVGRAKGGTGSPAVRGEDLVAEALGVVGPGGILWVVGDAGATGSYVSRKIE